MAIEDLVIRLSKEAPNHYAASAVEDDKMVASNSFALRFDELKIIERLKKLEDAAVSPQSEETFHQEFGIDLYNKVMAGELLDYFQKRQEAAEGLRISLQFDDAASELATLPWEFLHDGQEFLVAQRGTLLSRMPSKVRKIHLSPLDSVLRMLVVVSAPNDPSCKPLNAEKEREKILEAVDRLCVEGKMEVDFTDDATFETIQGYLTDRDYHIVHFTGHGRESDGQGYLVLETEDGKAREVDNQTVSDLLARSGIRLVVLSACQSADLANRLVRKKVPAVVAMQYSVLDESATRFAQVFYRALSSGKAVDVALTEARIAMRNAEGGNEVDFATPVLYLLDPHCLEVGQIKPAHSEVFQKPTMLGDVQVMKQGFVGRQRELRLLQRAFLSDVKRAAIVHGWGGMGKTVLATRLALRMDRHFEGIFGFKCKDTTRPEDILNSFNSFLNLAGITSLNQVLCQPIPLQAKTAALVAILNQRRFLVILNNMESCLNDAKTGIADSALKEFVEHLLNTTFTSTKFIITTRYDFDPLGGRMEESILHLSLPEMPFHQAVWLMNNHAELAKLDLKKKERIFRAIGGHPWTLGMFARHASAKTVDGLLLELEPLKRDLKEFTLFDKAYSQLDEASRELLVRASVFKESVPIEALYWVMGDEAKPSLSVDRPLEKLLSWGLMSRQDDDGVILYSVHTMVRAFAGQEAQKPDHRKLLILASSYYENQGKVNKTLWDLIKARDYYYLAGEWKKAADIVAEAWLYLARWGYIELAMTLLIQSAETTSGVSKAVATGNLATLYQSLGDWKTALKLYTKVKEVFEDLEDKSGISGTLHQMGNVLYLQGNYSEAVRLYQQSLKIDDDLGDKSGIASNLRNLGMIHQNQGDYAEAVRLYHQSLKIFQDLGDKSGIAATLHQLGVVHQNQGNYAEAVRLYQQSLKIDEDLGDKSGIATILHNLGNVHYRQGNYAEAVRLYQQTLKMKEELGNKSGIAQTLHQLGNIHFVQGNYPEAVRLYQQSLKIFQDLGDKSGTAATLHQLGVVHQNQGDYAEAIRLYQNSLKINEELGNKSGIAQTFHQLGNIHFVQGNYPESVRLYQQSLKIFQGLGDKSGIASTLHNLGVVHQSQGNSIEAVKLYQRSLKMAEELGDNRLISRSVHQLDIIRKNGKHQIC